MLTQYSKYAISKMKRNYYGCKDTIVYKGLSFPDNFLFYV